MPTSCTRFGPDRQPSSFASTCRSTDMERSLLNRSKGISSQRLFVMPDNHGTSHTSQSAGQQKSFSIKRNTTPVEDKENVNPDTFELAQNESRQRRHRLPQLYSHGDDCSTSKPAEEVSTPQDCKSRPPLRDITPIFQKVSRERLSSCSLMHLMQTRHRLKELHCNFQRKFSCSMLWCR